MNKHEILEGGCLSVLPTLPSNYFHTVVTSPPYLGLRKYATNPQIWKPIDGDGCLHHTWFTEEGQSTSNCLHCGAWRGELGMEPSPELYVEHLVQICREIRRVLRDDGTFWLNIGDSYWGGKGQSGGGSPEKQKYRADRGESINKEYHQVAGTKKTRPTDGKHTVIKPKDLCLIPYRLVIALQEDGWYVRSDITWAKRSCMPESVKDRPTCATEKIWMLTKSSKYYYDSVAVMEDSVSTHPSGTGYKREARLSYSDKNGARGSDEPWTPTSKRNMRNYWLLGPEPVREAHFATFPSEIPRRAIGAGTSEHGCCPQCGSPWERIIERSFTSHSATTESQYPVETTGNRISLLRQAARSCGEEYKNDIKTVGWRPSCECTDMMGLNPDRPQARRAVQLFFEKHLTNDHLRAIRSVGAADAGKAQITMGGAGKNTEEVIRLAAEAKEALGGYFREFTFGGSETVGWSPTCTCQDSELDLQPGDLEIIASPLTKSPKLNDDTITRGRRGLGRLRREDEGQRGMTRYEQRKYAEQIRNSPHFQYFEGIAGQTSLAHYTRTDRSGARPVPEDLLEQWIDDGLLRRVEKPTVTPFAPAPCRVLDPFCGSGTTAIAALDRGCDFVGIELNPEYIEIAKARILNSRSKTSKKAKKINEKQMDLFS
jgi:DNA modification methylase